MDRQTAKMQMDDISIHIRQMKKEELTLFKKIESLTAEVKELEAKADRLNKEAADLEVKKEQLEKKCEYAKRDIQNAKGELDALDVDIERRTKNLEQIRIDTAVAQALQKSEIEHLERDKRLEQLIEHYVHLDGEDFAFRFISGLGTKKTKDASGKVVKEVPILDIYLQSANREKNRLLQQSRLYIKKGGNLSEHTDLDAWHRSVQTERRLPSVNTASDSSGGSSPEPEL